MIKISQAGVLYAVLAGACFPAGAEDLDLTQVKRLDWAGEEHGREFGQHALLAPSSDLKELAGQLKKSHGPRLSSEDDTHFALISMGALPPGSTLSLSRAQIDRFRQFIELSCNVQLPDKDNIERPLPALKSIVGSGPKKEEKVLARVDRAEDWVIGPAQGANKTAGAQPTANDQTGHSPENPTLLLPVGRLQPGLWWLRIKITVKNGSQSFEKPALADSFTVKDDRSPQKIAKKKSEPPEVGLPLPNSPSALQGTGFGQ